MSNAAINATVTRSTWKPHPRWRPRITAAVGAQSLAAAAIVTQQATAEPTPEAETLARTTSGVVEGTADGDVERFQGLPYAAPPVDALRWRPPQPAPAWNEVRSATESGPSCAQTAFDAPGELLEGTSEDCLYLDVTAPVGGEELPVMVWIHGGGNTSGSGAHYDPARMAALGDAVVVTINYRLGVFGFFGHPELEGSGTFALQDQQAALKWVRTNAAAFGGDPDNVTVFGESAGGVDICGLLTSPRSAGLFDRAIMQSGSCLTRVPTFAEVGGPVHLSTDDFWTPAVDNAAAGTTLAAELRCTGPNAITCLREADAADVADVQARTGTTFGPAYGTAVLPVDPALALRSGLFHPVPVLSGINRDEARLTTMYAELLAGPFTPDSYRATLRSAFGDAAAAAIENEYPVGADGDAGLAFASMDTDRVFVCPQLETNRALADQTAAYGYEFADPDAPTVSLYFGSRPAGAAHGSELAYLFGLHDGPYAGTEPTELTPAQRELGDTMIEAWTGFARDGRAPWPAHPTVQALAPQDSAPVDAWEAHHCEFWSAQRPDQL